MRKGLIISLALILLVGFGGYTLAQYGSQNPYTGRHMMGQGQTGNSWMMGQGMWGHMGGGHGMMGGMGMIGAPEIMGTMMSIHGEVMSVMGQIMQKHGKSMWQMTPELQEQVRKEMLEQIGDILTKYGASLKEKAK